MAWVRNATVSDYYVREELDAAKVSMKLLRDRRQRAAIDLFGRWVKDQMMPCKVAVLVSGWAEVAGRELVSEPHMGRAGGPLPGFGPRWAERQLLTLGYRITGERRRVRVNQRNEWGELVYKSSDERIVHRNM